MVTVLMPLPAYDLTPPRWRSVAGAVPGRARRVSPHRRHSRPGRRSHGDRPGTRSVGRRPRSAPLTVVGRILRPTVTPGEPTRAVGRRAFARRCTGARPVQLIDALVLPGGHGRVACPATFRAPRCSTWPSIRSGCGPAGRGDLHGVLVAGGRGTRRRGARSHGRRTTAPTWALEQRAWGRPQHGVLGR